MSNKSAMPSTATGHTTSGILLMQDKSLPAKGVINTGIDAQCALHAQYVLQLLQLQRQAGFLCDITIHVKDRSFKAHKPLLAACSLYFRGLFADASTKESTALNLTALTPTGFEVLLDYIYSGSLAITAENSSEVLSAATCLQMTNVVETCLNFIRSSFRMCKVKEIASDGGGSDTSSASSTLNYHGGQYSEKHKYANSVVSNKPFHPQLGMSHLSKQDDNLQILSTKSINKAEFKSMISEPPKQEQAGSITTSRTDLQHLLTSSRPSTSQLQSVLPLLISNHPRQPTPKEVQQLLTSLPSVIDQDLSLPPSNNVEVNLAGTNVSCTSVSNLYKKTSTDASYSTTWPKSTVTTTSTSVSFSSISPSVPRVLQNGILPTADPSPVRKGVLSEKGRTTTYSVVSSATTPERYSGFAQTANSLSQTHSDCGVQQHRSIRQEKLDCAVQYSSDEQGNSVEISTDDESESDPWCNERSVVVSTDLSGTPCITTTHGRSLKMHNVTALSLTNYSAKLPYKGINSAPVSKTLSLPFLSDAASTKARVARVRSSEDGSQIITYEKAASAMAALSCSPISSTAETSSQASEERMLIDEGHTEGNASAAYEEQFNDAGQDGTSVETSILTKAIRSSLLPLKSSTDNSTLRYSLEQSVGSPRSSAKESFMDDKIDVVKIEDFSKDGNIPGRFPLPLGDQHDPNDSATSIDGNESSDPSQYSAEEHAEVEEDDGVVLDLSMASSKKGMTLPEKGTAYLSTIRRTVSADKATSNYPAQQLHVADRGVELAASALSMLKQSTSKVNWHGTTDVRSPVTNVSTTTSLPPLLLQRLPEDSVWTIQSGGDEHSGASSASKPSHTPFSRKPRRTTGGQTCNWPGCGRLFRHRNIYEEHQRLHELGIPVSQLRKCYMGARVKKTVREQLEELRTSESAVFDAGADGEVGKARRARKRKSTSDTREPIRKRVTVKDRPGPFQLFSQIIATSSSGSKNQTRVNPPPRIRQSLSHPPTTDHQAIPLLIRQSSRPSHPPRINPLFDDGCSPVPLTDRPTDSGSLPLNPGRPPQLLPLSQAAVPLHTIASSGSQPAQNPVEATLALLGIRTPARCVDATSSGVYLSSTATYSSDIRRRLAIRETAIVGAAPTYMISSPEKTLLMAPPLIAASSTNPEISGSEVSTRGFLARDLHAPAAPGSGAPPPRSNHNPGPNLSG